MKKDVIVSFLSGQRLAKDQIGCQKFDPKFLPANPTKTVSKSLSDSGLPFFVFSFSPFCHLSRA